jgi:hypothetical protein
MISDSAIAGSIKDAGYCAVHPERARSACDSCPSWLSEAHEPSTSPIAAGNRCIAWQRIAIPDGCIVVCAHTSYARTQLQD